MSHRERAPVVGDRFLADDGGGVAFVSYEVLRVEGPHMLVVGLDVEEQCTDHTRWLPSALFTYNRWFVLRSEEKEISL